MSALIFWIVCVAFAWVLGWMTGHNTGVLEGRALRELQQAYERPMVRRKS